MLQFGRELIPSRMMFVLMIVFLVSCQKISSRPADPDKLPHDSIPVVEGHDIYPISRYTVSPKSTDPGITTALKDHLIYYNTNPVQKKLLYLFLPGTYRDPAECQATNLKAVSLGYHSIGLMYDNLVAVNPLCSATGDITCHSRARREVIDGTDRHPEVHVNYTNSIVNRLYKLLIYLKAHYPDQHWEEFLDGTQPAWSKIIIAGHSQGGSLAGVIGKYYPVKKVILLSAIDFLKNGKMPDWQADQTKKGIYYEFINAADELVPYADVLKGWMALGMSDFGIPGNTASTLFPYNYTHTLITTDNPNTDGIDKYHNSTAVDAYIPKDSAGKYRYDQVWEYLITI